MFIPGWCRVFHPVLSTGLMVIAFLSLTCGLILDTVTAAAGRQGMAISPFPAPWAGMNGLPALAQARVTGYRGSGRAFPFLRFAVVGGLAISWMRRSGLRHRRFKTGVRGGGGPFPSSWRWGFTWLGNRYFTFRDRRARGFSAAIRNG